MKGTINQPCLFPPVHVIHKIVWSDVFVLMGQANFKREYKMSSMLLKGFSLGVPLKKSTSYTSCNNRYIVDDLSTWRAGALKKASKYYDSKAVYKFKLLLDLLIEGASLTENAFKTTQCCLNLLGSVTPILTDSDVTPIRGDPSKWVLALCKQHKIDHYIFGALRSTYLDKQLFVKNNIQLLVQDWVPPLDGNLSWVHYYITGQMETLRRFLYV